MQMHCDLDAEIRKIPHNHPYIAAVIASKSISFFLVAERIVICENSSFIYSLLTLIATYYTFDMQYPQPLSPILLFVQRVIMHVSDSAQVPNSVTKLVSTLDKITV